MFFKQLTKVDDARVGATLTHVDQLALDAASTHNKLYKRWTFRRKTPKVLENEWGRARAHEMPGVSASTMKPDRARDGLPSGSVLARTKYHCGTKECRCQVSNSERDGVRNEVKSSRWQPCEQEKREEACSANVRSLRAKPWSRAN